MEFGCIIKNLRKLWISSFLHFSFDFFYHDNIVFIQNFCFFLSLKPIRPLLKIPNQNLVKFQLNFSDFALKPKTKIRKRHLWSTNLHETKTKITEKNFWFQQKTERKTISWKFMYSILLSIEHTHQCINKRFFLKRIFPIFSLHLHLISQKNMKIYGQKKISRMKFFFLHIST